MCAPYNIELNNKISEAAAELSINLKKGIYAAVPGPNLETRAEYRYLKSIGADMVGMSTVPEVIVANHIGIQCAAVSVITDECNPDDLKPVNISEIIQVAGEADQILSRLLPKVIEKISVDVSPLSKVILVSFQFHWCRFSNFLCPGNKL